jgi:hypothetical protein
MGIEVPEPLLCIDCGKDAFFDGGADLDRMVWRSSTTGYKTTICLRCLEKRTKREQADHT